MLSKKHYNRVAAIIAETYNTQQFESDQLNKAYRGGIRDTARQLSEYFQEDNERFDTDKFWHACFGDE